MKKILIIFPVLLIIIVGFKTLSDTPKDIKNNDALLIDFKGLAWVDSVFNSLTLDERIAQTIMIRAHSNKDKAYHDAVGKLISDYNIGGICFFQGGPVRQANLTNYYQKLAKTPLIVSIDGEWGVAMRIDSVDAFPREMTLGAIQDNQLIYQMGKEIAKQCKRLGININFAPVVDVNNNPLNPVINSRSFGENRNNVAEKGIAYMKGLQSQRILACAKHFPGHGDTDTDSHYALPIIKHSKNIIDSIHIYPFKRLIDEGLGSIMVAHLFIPAYDNTKNTATTLSKKVITDLLINELGFKGLIITDALGMEGVAKYNKAGTIEVKALLAGNDILLLPKNVNIAIREISKAIKNGIIPQKLIDDKCKKVLAFKYWLGLSKQKQVKTTNIYNELNSTQAKLINRKLYASSITVVKNNNKILPLKRIDTLKIASVSIGYATKRPFQIMLGNYVSVDNFLLPKKPSYEQIKSLIRKLSEYNLVIVGIHNTNNSPKYNFGISQASIDFINMLKKKKKVILDVFASPYSLARFKNTKNIEAILVSYQDNYFAEEASAQVIFGGIAASGKLPVSASKTFNLEIKVKTSKTRLEYSMPENVGISSSELKSIDSIALSGIKEKAYPGCQIFIAKDGEIIYNKSFGYHTYDEKIPVRNSDLYDLASVTKITATTLAIMKLYEKGKIDIDEKLVTYLPYLKGTNKENIIIRELMAHQARLHPWIPYYRHTIEDDGKLNPLIYSNIKSDEFPYKVANDIFINKSYKDSIILKIVDSELRRNKKYRYSDLGFYLLKEIIEKITSQSLDNYVNNNFFIPLGLNHICYHPLKHFNLLEIIPTEDDKYFRNQLIHGYVHDPGAAMMNGVEGHAGLFSNSNDVAVIMQMLMQGGVYGGIRYFKESTVKEFTKQQFPLNHNRRGIGFDKPLPNNEEGGPACLGVSDNSFGHSGFTGTYAWADPDKNLVYVFLSNRVYPSAEENKLLKLNIRTNIHKAVYDAIDVEERK